MTEASKSNNVENDKIKINDLISYEVGEKGVVHVHLSDMDVMNMLTMYGLVMTGMKDLARMAEKDESIKVLTMTSSRIKNYAGQLESIFHLTIDGPVDEGSDVWKAHIDRGVLLEYFGPGK